VARSSPPGGEDALLFDKRGGVATLTLNRPDARNALTSAVFLDMERMLLEIAGDSDVPITKIADDTVFAEIHIQCGHRGTGNVRGCHRMMEYDRKMLERIGGQLVILRSQAEPGVKICKLAIRKAGASTADLAHAHERTHPRPVPARGLDA